MKDTIETDVWDNSIEDKFSSNWTLDDAVEADRKNLQINKSDVEQLIKTSEEIRKTADQLIGIGHAREQSQDLEALAAGTFYCFYDSESMSSHFHTGITLIS